MTREMSYLTEEEFDPTDANAAGEATPRCDGRYPVPQTAPPREEPFEATYRCARPAGHEGPHGALD